MKASQSRIAATVVFFSLFMPALSAQAADPANAGSAASATPNAKPRPWLSSVVRHGRHKKPASTDAGKAATISGAAQTSIDKLERRRATASTPAQKLEADIAEIKFLLPIENNPSCVVCQRVLDRAISGAKAVPDHAPPIAVLAYQLARVMHDCGLVQAGDETLAKAETLAKSQPASVKSTTVRCEGLMLNGQAVPAGEIAWDSALAAREGAMREPMLVLYARAAVLASRDGSLKSRLALMKAPAATYVTVANVLFRAGRVRAAVELMEAVPMAAIANDPKAARDMALMLRDMQEQQKKLAAREAALSRSLAAGLSATVEETDGEATTAANGLRRSALQGEQAEAFRVLYPTS